jgi:hypothetical protein
MILAAILIDILTIYNTGGEDAYYIIINYIALCVPLMDKRARSTLLLTIPYVMHKHSIKLLFVHPRKNKPENDRPRINVINKWSIE